MDDLTSQEPGGVTRREVLGKGAIVGGTLIWAAPMVQTIGMKAAGAQLVSPPDEPPCDTVVSVKWTPGEGWERLTSPNEPCPISCAEIGAEGDKAALVAALSQLTPTLSSEGGDSNCATIDLSSVPGFRSCNVSAIRIKTGSKDGFCVDHGSRSGRFTVCTPSQEISHVNLCVCCAPVAPPANVP